MTDQPHTPNADTPASALPDPEAPITRLRLAPLNALRAFEAVVRHTNVAKAAEELGVTPGAVSQQVRQLETLVGRELFVRHARGVEPTEAAAAVASAMTDGFDLLREASAALMADGAGALVRVGAPGDFAIRWLAPRLERFGRENPAYTVVLDTTPQPAGLEHFRLDLAISYGPAGSYSSARARLLSESVTAAGAPDLMARFGGVDGAGALSAAPLIHLQSRDEDPGYPDWASWLRARGTVRAAPIHGDRYSESALVVDAAVAGRGLALVRRSLAAAAFAEERLVPLVTSGVQTLTWGYDLSWLKGRGLARAARAVRDFIVAEAAPFEHMGV